MPSDEPHSVQHHDFEEKRTVFFAGAREVLFTALCFLVAVAPLVGGLYVPKQRYLIFALILFCAAGLTVVRRRIGYLSVAGLSGTAVVALYGIGMVTPASALGAVQGFMGITAAMAVFWAWRFLTPSAQEKQLLGTALVWSAFLVALWGLAEHVGLTAGKSAFLGRVSVGFGYPNATASWLAMGLVLAFLFSLVTRHGLASGLASSMTIVIGVALILTGSRGGWAAVALALAIALASNRNRAWAMIGYGMSTGLASLAGASALLLRPQSDTLGVLMLIALVYGLALGKIVVSLRRIGLWLTLAVIVVAGYGGYRLWRENTYVVANNTPTAAWKVISFEFSREQIEDAVVFSADVSAYNPDEQVFAGQISIWATLGENKGSLLYQEQFVQGETAIKAPLQLPEEADGMRIWLLNVHPNTRITVRAPKLVGASAEYEVTHAAHRLLPYFLAQRVAAMAVVNIIGDGRLEFIRDAGTAAQQALLFGRGGGAWQAVYQSVQANLYATARVHSDYMEVLLDVGIGGLAAYLIFLFLALHLAFPSGTGLPLDGVFALGATTILLHSAWEALFGFPSIYLGLFSLLGALRGPEVRIPLRLGRRVGGMLALLFCAAAVLSVLLSAAEIVASRADRQQALGVALKLNPWHAGWRVELAAVKAEEGERRADVTALYESARRLEPFSAVYSSLLGQHYARIGNLVRAVDVLEQTIDLQPMNIVHYENAAKVVSHTAELFAVSSPEEAEAYARRTLLVYERVNAVLKNADEQWLRRNATFRLTPTLAVEVGRALAILGRGDKAWPYLMSAAHHPDASLFALVNPWLEQLYGYSYRPHEARNLLPTKVSIVEQTQDHTSWRMRTQLDADEAWIGDSSLKGIATEGGGSGIGTSGFLPVRAGQEYAASVYVRYTTPRPILLRMDWFTEAGHTGYTHGTRVPVGETWQRLTVSGVAPEGATRLRLYVLTDHTAKQGDALWVDAWMVERGRAASQWVPGQFR